MLGFILRLVFSFQNLAGIDAFKDGLLIQGYGKHAKVKQDTKIPANITLKLRLT